MLACSASLSGTPPPDRADAPLLAPSGRESLVVPLKYASHLSTTSDTCPPPDALQRSQTCYRWVKDPLDGTSFVPPALMAGHPAASERTPKCTEFGLSMFETATHARTAYARITKRHPRFAERVGTHLAELKIELTHGVQSKARKGHFDLHEFDGVDLCKVATVVGLL